MSHSNPSTPKRPSPSKIASARMAADLSQAELARRIGVSRSLICEIEGGKRNATEEVFTQIAAECGRDPAELTA